MKKFQLKYSAPKTKVNSAGKVEQQNQKKPDRYCDTCSTITDIISKEPQSEEKSYKLTGSALFNKMFSDIKKAHIPVCSFSVYDSDFTFCYGNVINNRAVLLNYYSLSSVAVVTAADGILSDPALRSRLVYRLYLSTNSYLMIIFDSFAYETFKDENLKIISSMLDELKITLIQQKAVNK